MNNDEATTLAKRIINTWRLTPPLTEWVDMLAQRDTDTATATFIRLRDELDGALSIARFVKEYRAAITPSHQPSIGATEALQVEGISPTQYLARLRRRAAAGDRDALDELDRFERFTSGALYRMQPAGQLEAF